MIKLIVIILSLLFYLAVESKSQLIINEFMAAPNSGEPEWIELFNNSPEAKFFDSLHISDNVKSTRIPNFTAKSKAYIIISSDTTDFKKFRTIPDSTILLQASLPTLNNTTDIIVLTGKDNAIIDSVYYDMDWGKKGISLERIESDKPAANSDNLKASIDLSGATPGKINSLSSIEPDTLLKLSINEIMFDVSDGNAEYIEIYNNSTDTAKPYNYVIYDAAGSMTSGNIIIDSKEFLILPYNFGVITCDSAFFNKFDYLKGSKSVFVSSSKMNLNSTGDMIVLCNKKGIMVDSTYYYQNWHNKALDETKDISLEKLNEKLTSGAKESWTSCTDIIGGTPVKINSVAMDINYTEELSANPNPFSPFIGSKQNYTLINYTIPYQSSFLNVDIYDQSGAKVRKLTSNLFSGGNGFIKWDGLDDKNYNLPVGAYILYLEASDTITGNIYSNKILLVIGS
jgi:hypothetical protein